MTTRIRAGQLKHHGVIKNSTGYDETGQSETWATAYSSKFGIDKEVISKVDEDENTGNTKSLSLFAVIVQG